MKKLKTLLARSVSLISAFCVVVSSNSLAVYSNNIKAYAEDVQITEPQAKFTNTSVQAGNPITVELTGVEASSISYSWTVGGSKISNNSASYTPTESDYEKMISVTVTADGKEYTSSLYFSELPVVYINTDEEITSKTEYIGGSCKIQGNNEFTAESQLYNGYIKIRGRGNYTWVHDKKPYKIKLDTKTDVFGMGESKHWVLLAEYMDYTHIRNEIMPELSETLDMDYTANNDAVVVILNGEYNGLYHFSENVKIAKNRVNIYDWEDTAEDIAKAVYKEKKADGMTKDDRDNLEDQLVENLTWVTSGEFTWNNQTYKVSDYVQLPDGIDGGYLLELDTYDYYHEKQVSDFDTDGEQPIQFKSPEYAVTNSEMYNYAKNYIQSFENAVSADDYYADYDGESKHYSQLFDIDSLVKYWLVLELSSNCDGMRYSNYMYKDFGQLFKMGPAWDYDWTWNASYVVPTNEWWTDQNYYNETVHWYKYLVKDPYFLAKAYELYNQHKDEFAEVYADGGKIDTYSKNLETAAKADLAKWHSSHDFESEVNTTKEYVTARFNWLEQQFSSVESLAESLGYEASDKLEVTDISADGSNVTIKASVSEDSAEAVTFHINGIYAGKADISNGTASITVSSDMLEKDTSSLNTVQIRMTGSNGEYLKKESSNSNKRGGWEGWNPWEQEETNSSDSLVYSNFTAFTASEIGATFAIKGDVNCDGVVNAFDVVVYRQYLTSKINLEGLALANADVNGDGKYSVADLTLVQEFILGKVKSF